MLSNKSNWNCSSTDMDVVKTISHIVKIRCSNCYQTNLIGNCSSTRYGCCKDNITYCENKNCSNCYQTNLIGNCSSTRYGCCKDNITYCENKNCSIVKRK